MRKLLFVLFVLIGVLGLVNSLAAKEYVCYQYAVVDYNTRTFIPVNPYKINKLYISVENGKMQVTDGNNTVTMSKYKEEQNFYKVEFYSKITSGNSDVVYLWTPETRILAKAYIKTKKSEIYGCE